jgi:hypothetical protein
VATTASSSEGIRASERLAGKIALVRPVLRAAGARLFAGPDLAGRYTEYLVLCHGVVRASVPLMRTALQRAEELAPADEVARILTGYLPRHIAEELDHDTWLLEDLASLGKDPQDVLRRPPSASVAALVGAQYYWVLHVHPVALMGYMMVLESSQPTPEWIEGIAARTGHGPQALRTLAEHADLDPHHARELAVTIDALPLTPDLAALVGLSALHTVTALAAAFDDVPR